MTGYFYRIVDQGMVWSDFILSAPLVAHRTLDKCLKELKCRVDEDWGIGRGIDYDVVRTALRKKGSWNLQCENGIVLVVFMVKVVS